MSNQTTQTQQETTPIPTITQLPPTASTPNPQPATSHATTRKQSKHVILETKFGEFFIISTLCTRTDSQLIAINIQCGSLHVQNFASEEAAFQWLRDRNVKLKGKLEVPAIIGYIVIGSTAYLLVAPKVRADMELFGGHTVYTVEEKCWVKIILSHQESQSKTELKNIDLLCDFPFEGLHFFCETLDLTRKFPSPYRVTEFDSEFVWNNWLAQSFERMGMREWCVVLLQGMAIAKAIPQYAEVDTNVNTPGVTPPMQAPLFTVRLGLITRKSQRNPGTRYYARGINERGGVGNEMECELVMWMEVEEANSTDTEVHWNSFVWRRGTVPIWWRSELKSQVGESEIIIGQAPFEKCDVYYSSLLSRYGNNPIILCNMLRTGPKGDEILLSENYQNSLKHVRKIINLDVKMINFDWHHNLKQLGTDKAVMGLWNLLKHPFSQTDMSHGTILLKSVDAASGEKADSAALRTEYLGSAVHSCPSGKVAFFHSIKEQTGVIRFNCADSLDRTNISTFFACFQIVAEMCRRLGIPLDWHLLHQEQAIFSAWNLCDFSLSDILNVLKRTELISTLAEFFVLNGDICSVLYTNSPAMHSAAMRDFSPKISSAPINAVVAIQRRYQNLYLDAGRQTQYEMILGINASKYFPSMQNTNMTIEHSPGLSSTSQLNSASSVLLPTNVNAEDATTNIIMQLDCVSGYPSWCLKPLQSMFSTITNPDLLLHDYFEQYYGSANVMGITSASNGFIWVCPPDNDIAEVYIYLTEPCYLTELCLTISHGNSYDTSPHLLDLFIGPYLDKMHVIFQGLSLPRCANGLSLSYALTSSVMKNYEGNSVYDFNSGTGTNCPPVADNADWQHSPLTRVVHLVFRGLSHINPQEDSSQQIPMTLGKIELYGMVTRQSPKGTQLKLKQMDASLKVDSVIRRLNEMTIDNNTNNTSNGQLQQEQRPSAQDIAEAQQAERKYEEIVLKKMFGLPSNNNQNQANNNVLEEEATFLDCLELEECRLDLKISSEARDNILLNIQQRLQAEPNLNSNGKAVQIRQNILEFMNPDRFAYPRDEKTEVSLRKSARNKSGSRCFSCGDALGILRQKQCSYCYMKFCNNCISPAQAKIIEFLWDKPQTVCKRCHDILQRQEAILKKIKRLGEQQRVDRFKELQNQNQELLLHVHNASKTSPFLPPLTENSNEDVPLKEPSNQDLISLAEFPKTGVIISVPTSNGSGPVESILFPPGMSTDLYWKAPENTNNIQIMLALPGEAFIHSFAIVVDELGYTLDDAPVFMICAGNDMSSIKFVTNWDLAASAVGGRIAAREYLVCPLEKPIKCRLVTIRLSFPQPESESEPIKEILQRRLHLGRFKAFGLPAQSSLMLMGQESSPMKNITTQERIAFERFLCTPSRMRSQIRPLWAQYRSGRKILDMCIEVSWVAGFSVLVRHGDEGSTSQVKLVRVIGISTDSKGEMLSMRQLSRMVVPRTKNNTELFYDFSKPFLGNIITFEFLSNYGGVEHVPPKVALYTFSNT